MDVSDADFADAVHRAAAGEGDAAKRVSFTKLHGIWTATVEGDGIGDVDLREMAAARLLEYKQTWAVREPEAQQAAEPDEHAVIVVEDTEDEADSPVGGCPRDPASPRGGDAVTLSASSCDAQAAASPVSVQRKAMASPQSQQKQRPRNDEEEPWLVLWSRLSALGWQMETRVSADGGRKDHYYIPPHRAEGSPRRLDSRVKVRRYVAAAHASVPSGTPRAAGAGGDPRPLPEPLPLSLPLPHPHQLDIKKHRQALSQQQVRPSTALGASRQRNSPPTPLTVTSPPIIGNTTAAAVAGTGVKRKASSSLCDVLVLASDHPKPKQKAKVKRASPKGSAAAKPKAAASYRPSAATAADAGAPAEQLCDLVCGDTVLAQWPPDVAGFIEEGEDPSECSWYKATIAAVGADDVKEFALRYDDGEHDAVPWSLVRVFVPPVAAADATRRRLATLPVDRVDGARAMSSYGAIAVEMDADNEVMDSTSEDSDDDMSSDNEDEDEDVKAHGYGCSEQAPLEMHTCTAAAEVKPQPSPRGSGGRSRKPPPRWCDDPLATVELGGSAAKLQLIIDENSR